MRSILAVLAAGAALASCATAPSDVEPDLVSTYDYRNQDCAQLTAELAAAQADYEEHAAVQRQTRRDTIPGVLLVGVVGWMVVQDDRKEQIARTKGQIEAVQRSMAEKGCSDTNPTPPEVQS